MNAVMEPGTTAPDLTRPNALHLASDVDCDAFLRDIYDRYGPLLLRYATRLLDGDWHKGEDILQEAAARAWKHAGFLDGGNERLRPWLFTVVRNLVIDHHRARR